MKRIWLAAGVCAAGLGLAVVLSAGAAQDAGGLSPGLSAPDAEAPPANRPPTVGVRGGSVRAGEGLTLAAYAADMESAAVHLEVSLDRHPGAAVPAWLAPAVWTAGLSAQPVLRIPLSPPADAAPGAYEFLVGATDSGGLTSWRRMHLEVLPPARTAAPSGASSNPAGASSGGDAVPSAGASLGAVPKPASSAQPATAESPGLSLSVSPSSVSEGSARDVVVTATLTGVSMVPGMDVVGVLQVSGTAADGTDYTLTGTKSFTIPAGSATLTGTRTLRLAALADELRTEGDETVKLKVTQVTRGAEVLALSKAAKATVTITNVYAKPPAPSGVAASAEGLVETGGECGSSSCSLEISWEAPEASPAVTEYIVKARRRGATEDAGKVTVSGGTLKATFPGLKAGERYDVRVRARNRVGGGDWAEGAWGDTAPLVKLEAKKSVRVIGEEGGELVARLTASANVQVLSKPLRDTSSLKGQWHSVSPTGAKTALGDVFKLVAKKDTEHTDRSDSPAVRTYLFRATHTLGSGSSLRRTEAERQVTVTWRPKVVLDASPSLVAEDGGARTVTVTASLTGAAQDASSKSVTVKVKGGTAKEGRDFASVGNFTISIPGGAGSASGTFTLTPVADTEAEGGETVKVKGSAMQGTQALEVKGSQVVVQDERATLTVSPTPSNGSVSGTGIACGTGTAGDCSERVLKGASAALVASPASGYVFKEWSGACSSEKGASCAVVVSGATTVGASFRRPKVKVKVSPASGGSVTGSGIDCGSGTADDCSEKVSGGSIALTASPASGYAVSAWSGGGCSGTGTTCTASVASDTTVKVTFARQTRPTLTVSPTPVNGSVSGTGIACGAGTTGDCEEMVDSGTKVTLTASPATSYAVESWSGGGCTGTGTTCEVTVNADTTVAVTFAKPILTISPTPANGSVAGTGIACGAGTTGDCSETVNKGAKVTLTASPAANYAVESWSGGGCSGTGTTCEVTVNADTTVAVTFSKPTLTISPTPVNGSVSGTGIACGTGTSGDCEETVNSGASVVLTATPATNHSVKEWSGGGCTGTGTTCTVQVDSDTTVSVAFSKPTLTISPTPANGSVSGTGIACGAGTSGDCDETVNAGTSITLTATPAANYAVESWSGGGCSGTGTTCEVTVNADTTVAVTFSKPTLTISPAPANGSVTGTGVACGAGTSGDCSETVNAGTSITLTATPAANYAVESWSGGGCTGTGTTCEVTVNSDTAVSVTFSKPTLTISPAPTNGSVSGTGVACGAGTSGDCSETVNAGTKITLTASPAANYAVGSWSGGGCTGTGTTCEVTVNSDTAVSVTFAKPTLTISPAPTNGSVSGTGVACGAGTTGDCSETVNAGTKITLTASPAANYAVGSWSGGGCTGTGTTCEVTVNSDTTVAVTFAKPTLTISPAPTNGSVTGTGVACGAGTTGDCSETVNKGAKVTLTASPATNYAVKSWSGGGCTGTGTTCEVTVNSDTTVAVTFAKPTLTISPAPANGSVTGTGIACGAGTTGDCSETVNSGASVVLTAAPGSGYVVKEWGGACTGTGTTCTVQVDSDKTASVAFKLPDAFTVKVSPKPTGGHVAGNGLNCGAGSGRTTCSASLARGTDVSLTATAASGRRFGSWTGCPASTATATCAFKLSANATVGAAFIEQFTLTVSRSPSTGGTVSGSIVSDDGTVLTSGVVSCGSDCVETVDSGSKVKLTAAAASGHRFKDWTGCDSASGSVCTQTVGSAETVTANFVRQYTLTVSKSPSTGGTVSGSIVSDDGAVLTSGVVSCGSDCVETVDSGSKVKLTAAAAAGHRFKDWTGCDSASGSVCTQTVGSAETVTANFVQRHTLTVARMKHAGYVTGGGINCGAGTGRSLCSVTLDRGTSVTLTMTAHDHYRFIDWSGDCSGTASTCSLVLNGDKSVNLSFWVLYTLTVSTSPSNGGYVTGSGISCGHGGRTNCDTEDKIGTKVQLTATAAAGHRLTGWSGCAPSATDGAGQCTATISGHKTVTANFVRRYTLNAAVSPDGGGKVTGTVTKASGETTVIDCGTDCSEVVDANTTVKLAASPATGYLFDEWSGACTGKGSCSVVVNGNKSVTANFTKETYKLTVTKPSNGYVVWGSSINCGSGSRTDCMETVQHGTAVSLTATPDTGYKFDDWSGKCDGQTTATCTFVMTAPATAGVTFTKKTYKLEIKPKPSNGYVKDNNSGDVDIDCGSGTGRTDCVDNKVPHDTAVSLTAHPDTGYKLNSWTGQCNGTTATCTFSMTAPATAGATFTQKRYKLTVTSSSKGYATWGSRINCGSGAGRTDCMENNVAHGTALSLAATPNAGYKFSNWTCSPSPSGQSCPPAGMNSDLTITPNFKTTLTVNAGGPYQAIYHAGAPAPFNFGPYYTASVSATAQGGKPTYEYQWQGSTTGTTWSTSGRGYYFFLGSTINTSTSTTATVKARDANRETASDAATINFGSVGGASGQASSALPVPLGGELLLVWGGEGSVTASSEDAAVAAVTVDGPLLVVSGVSAGETGIVVEVGAERIRVAVEVGG